MESNSDRKHIATWSNSDFYPFLIGFRALKTFRLLAIAIAIFLSMTTEASAQCDPGPKEVAFFEHSNFEGACVILQQGNYLKPIDIGLPNDSISSIKVGADTKVRLCRDIDLRGDCQLFTENDPNLGNERIGNDEVSSAWVQSRGHQNPARVEPGPVAQGDCWQGAEKNGALCYPRCKAGFSGAGPICWKNCPPKYTDDGATCRRDANIINSDNSNCPWHDKCGIVTAKGCSTCPEGYANDGCTCRRDPHIFGKESYGRGAGYLTRSDYHGIFYRYIRDHRNLWISSGSPLTETEKEYLVRFFPPRLVNSMRIYEMEGMTGAFSHSASATTYGNDFIIIRKGRRNLRLLKHEFVHVCQYDQYGETGFATKYANQYVDAGYQDRQIEFEQKAYTYEGMPDDSTPVIKSYLGYCD